MLHYREDYQSYNRLAGSIRSLLHRLSQLPAQDPFRSKTEASLLSKLYDMALVDAAATITDVDKKITVSAFCRRRLAVIMCKLNMCQTVKMAVQFIEQGHVRIGPDTMTDPAFLVTRFVKSANLLPILTRHSFRNMEDFVTWVDTCRRTCLVYFRSLTASFSKTQADHSGIPRSGRNALVVVSCLYTDLHC